MDKTIINTMEAPAPIGPYNQAVKTGDLLFISGQIALVPGTEVLLTGSIAEETQQVMENLKAILKSENADFKNVIKTTIFPKVNQEIKVQVQRESKREKKQVIKMDL